MVKQYFIFVNSESYRSARPILHGFIEYFTNQWFSVPFDKWQLFNTQPGYLLTLWAIGCCDH